MNSLTLVFTTVRECSEVCENENSTVLHKAFTYCAQRGIKSVIVSRVQRAVEGCNQGLCV